MTREENLVDEIIAAFPHWNPARPKFDPRELSIDELKMLRDTIWSAQGERLIAQIGVILVGMLNRHPSDLYKDASYDLFIAFLNAKVDSRSAEDAGSFIEDRRVNDYSKIQETHAKLFVDISSRQADIIYKWLNLAKDWECSVILREEIIEAMDFWSLIGIDRKSNESPSE